VDDGLHSAFLAAASIMKGAEGSSDALTSFCRRIQLQNQQAKQEAAELKSFSEYMMEISSQLSSMFAEAVAALDASIDNLRRLAGLDSPAHHPEAGAMRSVYDSEARHLATAMNSLDAN
jgi:hypothetical protein